MSYLSKTKMPWQGSRTYTAAALPSNFKIGPDPKCRHSLHFQDHRASFRQLLRLNVVWVTEALAVQPREFIDIEGTVTIRD
jgi:hypothetical protein